MSRLLLLSLAALCVFVSVQAQDPALNLRGAIDPQSGAIDVDRLRNQVLSQTPLATTFGNPLQGMMAPDEASSVLEAELNQTPWGVQLMPVPEVLRPAHDSLIDGAGLMVLEVMPGLTADQVGIQPGMVLVEQNGLPLKRITDLRQPQVDQKVIVLTLDGLRTATVTDRVMPHLPPHDVVPTGESVSVSNVNGLVCIDATLPTAKGMKRLQLRGTAAEVDRQIDALPRELAIQIRQRVSY